MDDANNNDIRQRLRPRRNATASTKPTAAVVSMSSSSASSSSSTTSHINPTTFQDKVITNDVIPNKNSKESVTTSSIDATPPFHTLVVYGTMVFVLLYHLPTLQQIDEIATIQVITQCQYFSSLLSIHTIATIRCLCTIFIAIVLLRMIYNKTGWFIITPYLKESKLMKHVQHHMIGIKTLYPFTSWSFVLLGLYFTLASYITMQAIGIQRSHANSTTNHSTLEDAYSTYNQTHRTLLRSTIILWEISAPCTILIAVIVRYVMWPAALRRIQEEIQDQQMVEQQTSQGATTVEAKRPPRPSHSLNSYQNICMHNVNVALALFERCILSGIPVRYNEWALAPLYGYIYVLFSWNMIYQYNDRKLYGPHFIYFFLDTTLPGYTCSYALIALLLVLLVFYSLYCSIESVLYYIHHAVVDPLLTIFTTNTTGDNEYYYLLAHVIVVLFISSLVMRFRD